MGKSSCVYKAKNAVRSNLTPPKGADIRTRRQLSEPRSGSEDTSSKEAPAEAVIIDKFRINPVAFVCVDLVFSKPAQTNSERISLTWYAYAWFWCKYTKRI